MNKGKIHQIIGPVIDIKFNEDEMPELLNAANIEFQLFGCALLPKSMVEIWGKKLFQFAGNYDTILCVR